MKQLACSRSTVADFAGARVAVMCLLAAIWASAATVASELADAVRHLEVNILSDQQRQELSDMVPRDIERRRLLATQRENRAWASVKTRADWEQFRDAELLARGAVVCLPDVRGVGETSAGGWLGPRSTGTTLSCRDQVLGQTMLGARLRCSLGAEVLAVA